jgi:ribonuclease VapC
MSKSVLDASALLALLLQEPGAEIVKGVIGDAAVSAVNIAEVVGHFAKFGADHGTIQTMLSVLPLTIMPADEALSFAVGMMRPTTAHLGLSLGDRYCLALAKSLGARAVTADRDWVKVAKILSVDVVLIR